MAEYEEDKLADNSDDENGLFRAEVRAGKKIKQKSAKEAKKKVGPAEKPYKSSLWASLSLRWGAFAEWRCDCFQPCSRYAVVDTLVC